MQKADGGAAKLPPHPQSTSLNAAITADMAAALRIWELLFVHQCLQAWHVHACCLGFFVTWPA